MELENSLKLFFNFFLIFYFLMFNIVYLVCFLLILDWGITQSVFSVLYMASYTFLSPSGLLASCECVVYLSHHEIWINMGFTISWKLNPATSMFLSFFIICILLIFQLFYVPFISLFDLSSKFYKFLFESLRHNLHIYYIYLYLSSILFHLEINYYKLWKIHNLSVCVSYLWVS